ncbi:MAG: phosphoribosylformylglycinamidine synthase subunit PurS [Dehalococcoidia bacterium]
MQFEARVYITLKPAVNDPQGNAVLGNLHALGFATVEDVRVGKFLTLRVSSPDQTTAQHELDAMCDKLLANPVIEAYQTEISAVPL